MQRNTQVGRRYASALFQLATDKTEGLFFGNTQKILAELKNFLAVTKDPEVENFLLSPVVKVSQKKEILESVREKFPLTYLFLSTLIESRRLDALSEVVAEFSRLCEEMSGELSVELELAHPANESLIEEIRELLQEQWQRNIKVKQTINPEIIGGFVARAPGKILDASVATQLENLEQQIFA